MGFDLSANNGDCDNISINLTGWTYLHRLLRELRQDTTEMASTNDGDPIEEETCSKWGKAIKEVLEQKRLFDVRYKDNMRVGGWGERPLVVRQGMTIDDATGIASIEYADLGGVHVIALDDRMTNIITSWAEFFINCRGCRQY